MNVIYKLYLNHKTNPHSITVIFFLEQPEAEEIAKTILDWARQHRQPEDDGLATVEWVLCQNNKYLKGGVCRVVLEGALRNTE